MSIIELKLHIGEVIHALIPGKEFLGSRVGKKIFENIYDKIVTKGNESL